MRPLMAAQSSEPILTWEETAALIREAKTDPRAKRQQIAANISKMAAKADDDTLVKLSVEAELFLQWMTSVRPRTPRYGVSSVSAVAGLDRDFFPVNPLVVAAARACALPRPRPLPPGLLFPRPLPAQRQAHAAARFPRAFARRTPQACSDVGHVRAPRPCTGGRAHTRLLGVHPRQHCLPAARPAADPPQRRGPAAGAPHLAKRG